MTNESHKEQTHSENSTYDVCPDCMYPVEPEWDTCPFCAVQQATPWTARARQSIIDYIDFLADPWEVILGDRIARLFAAVIVGNIILSAIALSIGLLYYLVEFLR